MMLMGVLSFAVDIDGPFLASPHDAIIHSPPEFVRSLWDTAFTVTAECHTVNLGAFLQQPVQGVAAIGGVVFRRQPLNPVVDIRAVGLVHATA